VILPWYGHWPAFNVADSAICAAAALFLISGFLNTEKS
jgi:lipoprotein signal peptidase